jgi:hypothetical protein
MPSLNRDNWTLFYNSFSFGIIGGSGMFLLVEILLTKGFSITGIRSIDERQCKT